MKGKIFPTFHFAISTTTSTMAKRKAHEWKKIGSEGILLLERKINKITKEKWKRTRQNPKSE
jgi:hypothetical protein